MDFVRAFRSEEERKDGKDRGGRERAKISGHMTTQQNQKEMREKEGAGPSPDSDQVGKYEVWKQSQINVTGGIGSIQKQAASL